MFNLYAEVRVKKADSDKKKSIVGKVGRVICYTNIRGQKYIGVEFSEQVREGGTCYHNGAEGRCLFIKDSSLELASKKWADPNIKITKKTSLKKALVESLAGTGALYVILQGRIKYNSLKIQGKGIEVNRSYGVTEDVAISNDLIDYLNKPEKTQKSLAVGSDEMYFELRAKVKGNVVHFQVPGPSNNRIYGHSFDVEKTKIKDVAEFLTLSLSE